MFLFCWPVTPCIWISGALTKANFELQILIFLAPTIFLSVALVWTSGFVILGFICCPTCICDSVIFSLDDVTGIGLICTPHNIWLFVTTLGVVFLVLFCSTPSLITLPTSLPSWEGLKLLIFLCLPSKKWLIFGHFHQRFAGVALSTVVVDVVDVCCDESHLLPLITYFFDKRYSSSRYSVVFFNKRKVFVHLNLERNWSWSFRS